MSEQGTSDNLGVTNTSTPATSTSGQKAPDVKVKDTVYFVPTNEFPANTGPYAAIVTATTAIPGQVSLFVFHPGKPTPYPVGMSAYDGSDNPAPGTWHL